MAEERKTSLTKRDVNRVIARWYITTEMSLNYERMQSIAYTYALIPALKKLYPNKEDMIPALQRHLELFNTNARDHYHSVHSGLLLSGTGRLNCRLLAAASRYDVYAWRIDYFYQNDLYKGALCNQGYHVK